MAAAEPPLVCGSPLVTEAVGPSHLVAPWPCGRFIWCRSRWRAVNQKR
uniref:Uncharacterized protein n=1 Tax=Arundo donax TaxID=35708 RepID=A0A0A9GRC3_ARUDO